MSTTAAIPAKELDKLIMLALELASWPTQPSTYAERVLIPWSIIEEIRAECDRRGIPWRTSRHSLGEQTRIRHRNWVLNRRSARTP